MRSQGFTLIEVAVVVVIISMLLSLGLGALNAQLASAAQGETKKRQAFINDALIAYLGANKRLPCPDDPQKTDSVTNPSPVVTGREDRDGGSGTDTACSANNNIGVVPYEALGLSREVALDGWGNFMSYSLPAGDGVPCPSGRDWSRSACFGLAKDSPYEVYEGTVAAATLAASNVLAVVVSHGPNGFSAWARVSQNVGPTRCEEKHNAKTGICSGQKPDGSVWSADDFFGGQFTSEVDDVVLALTRDEAINTLVKQGTLKSVEGQVAEDLAKLRNEKLNEKVLGSCSNRVNVTLPETLPSDPWGKPYVIVEGSDDAIYLPICICSTRKDGVAPDEPEPNSTCSPVAPTVCVEINLTEVNDLRDFMGTSYPPCLPTP